MTDRELRAAADLSALDVIAAAQSLGPTVRDAVRDAVRAAIRAQQPKANP